MIELAGARLLVVRWAEEDWPAATRVEIHLDAGGDSATTVRLRHTGWEALPAAAAHRSGRLHHLNNLRRCAELNHQPTWDPHQEVRARA